MRLVSIGPAQVPEEQPVKKGKGKPKFEHEDWCNSCRDGGELVMCFRCPRGAVSPVTPRPPHLTSPRTVFHPECYGVSKAHVARTPMMLCSQHSCWLCARGTGDAGGMLFRYALRCRVLLGVVLIRAGAKRVHKPFAKTAYLKRISMLSGIPYRNCSSAPLPLSGFPAANNPV